MTTSELLTYIKKQIKNNISKELIVSKLLSAGWYQEDIDEGFLSIELENKLEGNIENAQVESIETGLQENLTKQEDRYREPLIEKDVFELKKENTNIEVSSIKNDNIGHADIVPKVWTPRSVPVSVVAKPSLGDPSVISEIKIEKEVEKQIEEKKELTQTKEELIPTLMPKTSIPTQPSTANPAGGDYLTNKGNYIPVNETSKNYSVRDLPKMAMLSSYERDLKSVNQQEVVATSYKKHINPIKWIILLASISFVAGVAWYFASGYINLDKFKFSFIKKDPKVLLLNHSEILSSLKSYKTETSIEINSPSFANISAGLVGGEAITSLDKDFVSISSLGVVNKNENSFLSSSLLEIKSSLLDNNITTDIKNNDSDLFISLPNLSNILGENAPESITIKINENESDIVSSLFPSGIGTQLKKINLYKFLSGGMSSYVNNDIITSYNTLIDSMEIMEKGQENIKGIDTYHYQINTERQSMKMFLTAISNNFTNNLSEEDMNQLNQILGSTTVKSFDVWIGKDNGNIYQYNIVLDIPLSKIIGFEDKSIGDNKISIDWKTTYYDFDIQNEIFIPDRFISVTDFEKNIQNMRIKNSVSSFKQLATNLFNIEGVYGNKSNLNGSCMNPASGSLFSPVGHAKGALSAISSISGLLSKAMKETNDVGFCYSTSKSWSFSLPVSATDNLLPESTEANQSFVCIDNTGEVKTLLTAPTGPICK